MLELLEEMMNEVCDSDAAWWPFGFLRPPPHAPMTSGRVLLVAALYGIFLGLLLAILFRAAPDAPAACKELHPLAWPLGATALLFVVYRTTFAFFWNRRAARLSTSR